MSIDIFYLPRVYYLDLYCKFAFSITSKNIKLRWICSFTIEAYEICRVICYQFRQETTYQVLELL